MADFFGWVGRGLRAPAARRGGRPRGCGWLPNLGYRERRLGAEALECRNLLTVTANVVAGVLTISSDAADNIAITESGGNVLINGVDPNSGAAAANTITQINFSGFTGNNDNNINLNGVTPAAFTALASISVDAGPDGASGDTITLGGTLTTSGNQVYNEAVILNGTTTLNGAAITFNDTVDSDATPRGLTVNASGTTQFNAAVGAVSTLLILTTDAAGTTQLGANVTTLLGQAYNDPVVLLADVTVTGENVAFLNTVDASAAGMSLSAVVSVQTTFAGVVGGTTALESLTTDAPGTTVLDENVTTTGDQTYNDDVTLTGSFTLSGTNIAFNAGLDSDATARDLIVNASGVTTFADAVGGANPLASLSTDSAGSTTISGGAITTTGAQTYNDDVLLGADATLAGTNISFGDTLNSSGANRALTVNASLATTFAGAVGGVTALASLTTDAAGTTSIGGGAVTTTGAQTYNDDVTLTADTTLVGTAVTFGDTVNSDATARDLIVNASAQTTFSGAVGNTNPLAALATNAAGTTLLAGGTIVVAESATFNDAVTLGANTTVTGPDVTFGGTVNSDGTARSLAINASDVTTLNAAIGGTAALASLTTDGPGTTLLAAGAVTTTGAQTYNDPVTLGANTTLTGSNIVFNSTVNSDGTPRQLSVNSTTQSIFAGAVGGTAALASLTTAATGTTQLTGGAVTTTGAQTYNAALQLGANTVLTGTNITFLATINSVDATARSLTVNASGLTDFDGGGIGGVNPLLSITTDAAGTTRIEDTTVVTTGAQTYNDAVTLADDVTLSATDVTFNNTLNSDATARALNVNASGITTFAGAVGGTNPLASLTTNAAGTTAINGGAVTTSGTQTYNDPVTLGAGTNLTGAAVIFGSTVNSAGGARALTINATGATSFGGLVGGVSALASLVTNAGGTTAINGGGVNTTGNQTYGDPVTLGANTVLNAVNITFSDTVNSSGGARSLTLNGSGQTLLSDEVGAISPLASLVTDAEGTTTISDTVATLGAQTYNDDVILGPETSFGGAVTFVGAIQAPPPDGTNETWLQNMYYETLRRQIDLFGFNSWLGLLNQGISRVDIAQGIVGSTEYRTMLLGGWYQQYLGRAIDPTGLQQWLLVFEAGVSPERVLQQILASDEYFSANGGTNATFAAALADDLWAATIDPAAIAGLNREQIVALIAGDNQYTNQLINGRSGVPPRPFDLTVGDWFGRVLNRTASASDLAILDTAISDLTGGIRWNDALSFILASEENFDV